MKSHYFPGETMAGYRFVMNGPGISMKSANCQVVPQVKRFLLYNSNPHEYNIVSYGGPKNPSGYPK